jgi:hypothetical protein
MKLSNLLVKTLLLACVLADREALAAPTRCAPGYQDATCLTPIGHAVETAPACSNAAGWTTIAPAAWIGSGYTSPQCSFQAAPTCPAGDTQTQAPTWNGSTWVGLACVAPAPSVIFLNVDRTPLPNGEFAQLIKGEMWLITGDGVSHGGPDFVYDGQDNHLIDEGTWDFLVYTSQNGTYLGAEAVLSQQQYQSFNPIPVDMSFVLVNGDPDVVGVPISMAQPSGATGLLYVEVPQFSVNGIMGFFGPDSRVFDNDE